jgi:hypothetical protein
MSMKLENVNAWTRCALLTLALSLAGCGGGGESGGASAGSGGVSAAMKSDTSGQITSTPLQAPGIDDDSGLTAQQATSPALDLSSVVPRLNAGDPRNGVYYVYSADGSNGTRQKLGINFDTKSYSLVNSKGSATSGTFSEDPVEPGTYVFASSRITSAVNTARFRITTDAIVGAFPFEKPWSDPVAYEVTPFVAARTFVTAPALTTTAMASAATATAVRTRKYSRCGSRARVRCWRCASISSSTGWKAARLHPSAATAWSPLPTSTGPVPTSGHQMTSSSSAWRA